MRILLLLMTSAVLLSGESPDWILALGGRFDRDAAGNVVAVNLRGSWINDLEVMNLASLSALQRLDLSHTRISDEGLLLLKPARNVTDLNLYYAESITDQGMAAIREWKNLKRLNMRGTRISDGTLEIISHLTQLEALDIANTPITDNGLDHLITLTSLKELSLGRKRLSENGLEVLRLLSTLTYLDLGGPRSAERPDLTPGNRVGEGGAMDENLVRAISELKELRVLKLGYSNISAQGLKILGALPGVERLGLDACTQIDDAALTELASWQHLEAVDLQGTHVTQKGLDRLQARKPGLKVLAGPFDAATVLPASGQDQNKSTR
jgi:internalin A